MQRGYSRVEVEERMTSEEFFREAPEDRKAELIDGILILPAAPFDTHERLYGFVFRLLAEYVERFDLGEVRGSRTAVELAHDQVYEPDILFVSRERLGILQEKGVFGAPDLVVEILSASTSFYDRGTKLRHYDQAGVRELWLLDPYGPDGTELYQRQDAGLRKASADADGILHSVALPGFRLRLSWLWPAGRFIPVREAIQSML